MNFKVFAGAATAALLALGAASAANASTLFSYTGPTPATQTDTNYFATFAAPGGAANLSFVLDGYLSLDGQNFYEDDFTLVLNSNPILSGTFNLGGGGNDVVFFAPGGATVNNVSGNGTSVTFAGGNVNIATPLTLVAGLNTLEWHYDSLPGPGHAGFQGLGDEGWGLEKILVSGGVPEPASWALMITGFGLAGAALRRRRAIAA